MQLAFSPHIFEKYSNINSHENLSRGREGGRSDGHTFDEAKSLFRLLRTRLKTTDCDSHTAKYGYLFNSPNFLAS
jgi:hypothetical protein